MADPVRNEPLSNLEPRESPAGAGPMPVTPGGAPGLLPEQATDQPVGEWPEERAIRTRRRPAEGMSVAGTVGRVIRNASDSFRDRVSDLRYRFRVIRGRVESGELQEEMKDRASDVADEASRQARGARNRAEYYARNYPLQLIAGAAAAGFAIGFLLRIGRDE